jgi:hypothetical protein
MDLRRSLAFRLSVIIGVPILLLGGIGVLSWLDADKSRVLLPCLVNRLLGIDCIGCGATRALQALLHGDLEKAASANLFMLVWLPLPLWSVLREWLQAIFGRPIIPPIRDHRWLMITLIVSALLFFILRNLPWAPFNWLAA